MSEGDSFTPSGEDGTRGLVSGYVPPQERTARGGLVFVFSLGIAPVSGGVLTTGVVIRRRAVSGETARGGLVFVFFLEVAPVSEGDSFTPSGEDGTRGLVSGLRAASGEDGTRGGGFSVFSLGIAPVSGGVLTTGVVIRRRAVQERRHEGGWFLFFSWRLLRCRRGILSHPQERTARGG